MKPHISGTWNKKWYHDGMDDTCFTAFHCIVMDMSTKELKTKHWVPNSTEATHLEHMKVLYYHAKHKSTLAVTCHLNRNQNSIFNATVPCPRTAPTKHRTITKHDLQRINARPYPQKKDVASIAVNASLHSLEAPTKRFFCRRSSWMPLAQRTR